MTPKQAVFFLVFPQYLFRFLPENVLKNVLENVFNSGVQLKPRADQLKPQKSWKGSFDTTYLTGRWLDQLG